MTSPTLHSEAVVEVPASSHDGAPAIRRRAFSTAELAFILGVPAAWAILLLFHPLGGNSIYALIEDNVTAWLTVHLGMGIFVPLFAGVVLLLLRGVKSTAATVSRLGLAVFAVGYAAWELLLGAGSGILTQQVTALPEGQQAVGADLVESYFESGVLGILAIIGSVGLGVAMIGAAVALRGAYRVGWVPLVLMVLSIPLISYHEPPLGPSGLAIFIVAALLIVMGQRRAPEPALAAR